MWEKKSSNLQWVVSINNNNCNVQWYASFLCKMSNSQWRDARRREKACFMCINSSLEYVMLTLCSLRSDFQCSVLCGKREQGYMWEYGKVMGRVGWKWQRNRWSNLAGELHSVELFQSSHTEATRIHVYLLKHEQNFHNLWRHFAGALEYANVK